MYWKLVDKLEYDYGEYPLFTKQTLATVMANDKEDAEFWILLLYQAEKINIPQYILSNISMYIEKCTLKEYLKFINTINKK